MATYYVSPFGSSSNNGSSPDASAGTNGPVTLDKAFGSTGVAGPGDTVYIAPGVYRGTTAVGVSGSAGSPITIAGDPANARGFKDGSGNLISAGEVRLTNRPTNDMTAAVSANTLAISNKSYLAFSNLWVIGGGPSFAGMNTLSGGGHDISFTNCCFQQSATGFSTVGTMSLDNTSTSSALNVTVDRCIFIGSGAYAIKITLAKTNTGTSDYDANVVISNSLFLSGSHVSVNSSGSGTYSGGGVTIQNCTMLWPTIASVATAAGVSTTYPVKVYNCVMLRNGATPYSVATSGQLVEDYNLIGSAATSNFTLGSHTVVENDYCLLLDFGQSQLWGQAVRPMASPTAGSSLLGFGNQAGSPTVDFLNRPRPAGGQSLAAGIGYIERHDTAVMETTITDSGGVGIRIDGPGSQEFQIPVDPTATTISVKCRYDSNHGTSTPPQAIMPGEAEIGVSGQTVTASATTGTWLTLTFSSFTPTARGVVRVRLVSRPSNANGIAYFDTFNVS